jgi:hypothetical protein
VKIACVALHEHMATIASALVMYTDEEKVNFRLFLDLQRQ